MGKLLTLPPQALFALAATSASAETTWDMSVVWPEGNFHTQNAIAFAEAVKEATGGEVASTVHSAARSVSRGGGHGGRA